MKRLIPTLLTNTYAIALAIAACSSAQASVVFDDFNVNEGHFNQAPSFSGSTAGILGSSTADRVTNSVPREGSGHEQLVLRTNGASSVRVRFLSGGGTIANNTSFNTSTETDGWIGCYVKTTNTGWNVQIWLENASVNGGVPKDVIADGEWHLYEWNLDDDTGGADGWGSIAGVLGGSATVSDGAHSIDSIVFRNSTIADGTNVLFLDYVAKSDSGSVGDLLLEPCVSTSGVLVNGPLSTNVNQVLVTGVAGTATALGVYQDTGSGMTVVGTKSSGIVAGNNYVTVNGLVKGAIVSATQTVNGQESCVPKTGVIVGGGANPPVKIALTIREMTNTSATIGEPGAISGQTTLHFLGATTVSGGAPMDAQVIYPSTSWQTVTFDRGTIRIPGPASAAGVITAPPGFGYNPNDIVGVRVYAFRTVPETGVLIYSATPAQASTVSSNDYFAVDWTWEAVPNANGYRLLRDLNAAGYVDYTDVYSATALSDANNVWTAGDAVTPSLTQTGASIQWNPTVGNLNTLPGKYGCLESINFVIADTTDTGPYDLYIDNLQNGSTVFQTFEESVAGALDYGFRVPTFSGTTSGGILTSPDLGTVSNDAADSGTKSFRVSFQWNSTTETKWLRLTTSGVTVNNPYVDLDQPISFRLLLLPVGAKPVAPPAPSISASLIGGQTVLNWTGAHQLQAAPAVTGAYTNVPSATIAPYTNTDAAPERFFRLVN